MAESVFGHKEKYLINVVIPEIFVTSDKRIPSKDLFLNNNIKETIGITKLKVGYEWLLNFTDEIYNEFKENFQDPQKRDYYDEITYYLSQFVIGNFNKNLGLTPINQITLSSLLKEEGNKNIENSLSRDIKLREERRNELEDLRSFIEKSNYHIKNVVDDNANDAELLSLNLNVNNFIEVLNYIIGAYLRIGFKSLLKDDIRDKLGPNFQPVQHIDNLRLNDSIDKIVPSMRLKRANINELVAQKILKLNSIIGKTSETKENETKEYVLEPKGFIFGEIAAYDLSENREFHIFRVQSAKEYKYKKMIYLKFFNTNGTILEANEGANVVKAEFLQCMDKKSGDDKIAAKLDFNVNELFEIFARSLQSRLQRITSSKGVQMYDKYVTKGVIHYYRIILNSLYEEGVRRSFEQEPFKTYLISILLYRNIFNVIYDLLKENDVINFISMDEMLPSFSRLFSDFFYDIKPLLDQYKATQSNLKVKLYCSINDNKAALMSFKEPNAIEHDIIGTGENRIFSTTNGEILKVLICSQQTGGNGDMQPQNFPNTPIRTYKFDKVFDKIDNSVMSSYMAISNIIDNLEGVMMYTFGFSGVGKSFTLFGSAGKPGLLQAVLKAIQDVRAIKVRVFEIYGIGFNDSAYWNKDIIAEKYIAYKVGTTDGTQNLTVRGKSNVLDFVNFKDSLPEYFEIPGDDIDRYVFSTLLNDIDTIRKDDGFTYNEKAYKTVKPTKNNPVSSRSILIYEFIVEKVISLQNGEEKVIEVPMVIVDMPGKELIVETYGRAPASSLPGPGEIVLNLNSEDYSTFLPFYNNRAISEVLLSANTLQMAIKDIESLLSVSIEFFYSDLDAAAVNIKNILEINFRENVSMSEKLQKIQLLKAQLPSFQFMCPAYNFSGEPYNEPYNKIYLKDFVTTRFLTLTNFISKEKGKKSSTAFVLSPLKNADIVIKLKQNNGTYIADEVFANIQRFCNSNEINEFKLRQLTSQVKDYLTPDDTKKFVNAYLHPDFKYLVSLNKNPAGKTFVKNNQNPLDGKGVGFFSSGLKIGNITKSMGFKMIGTLDNTLIYASCHDEMKRQLELLRTTDRFFEIPELLAKYFGSAVDVTNIPPNQTALYRAEVFQKALEGIYINENINGIMQKTTQLLNTKVRILPQKPPIYEEGKIFRNIEPTIYKLFNYYENNKGSINRVPVSNYYNFFIVSNISSNQSTLQAIRTNVEKGKQSNVRKNYHTNLCSSQIQMFKDFEAIFSDRN